MRVALDAVAKGRRDVALPPTTLSFATGRATLAVAETAQRPTVLGLIASGRMKPDAGALSLDGETGRRATTAVRRHTALIDAPDVSEPAPDIPVVGVVAEELMFAGLPSDPLSARRWLDAQGLRDRALLPFADIDPTSRIRLLLELAAARPGIRALVLVSPDRHGGDPRRWWATAQDFAARGLAVLVIAGEASATALAATPAPAHTRLRPSRVRPARRVSRGRAAAHQEVR